MVEEQEYLWLELFVWWGGVGGGHITCTAGASFFVRGNAPPGDFQIMASQSKIAIPNF